MVDKEPERYYDWILWKLRQERQTTRSDMMKDEVISLLKNGVSTLMFEKVDGTKREMHATLDPSMLPVQEVSESTSKTQRKKSIESLAVFDTVADGWRSFRWDKLLTVNGVKFKNAT